MANRTESRPVVYCYVDPAFAWDVGPALADLERRGFRVVTGDNADELQFLLQMGRPAAIIYTVAKAGGRAQAEFQLVASRAVDTLVPLFVVGPDDPRDGVVLRYPEGGAAEENHVPFHALGDLIERFDAEPPSSPSRPPMAVASQTFGKGRTMMSWRRDGPIVTPPDDGRPPLEPLPSPPPPQPTGEARQVDPKERETFPAKKKQPREEDARVVPSATPTISAISVKPEAPHPTPDAPAREPISVVRAAAEPSLERPPARRASRPVAWKIPAALAGGVAIGVAALVAYLATAPGPADEAPPPAPAIAPRPAPISNRAPKAAAPPADVDANAAREPTETPPPAFGETTGGGGAPRQRNRGEPQIQEALLVDPSGTVRFPGHFRDQSAIFWFAGDWEERRFLDLVRSLGPTAKLRLIGHSTAEEIAAGLHNLALSRAWAVEKYLVRQGIEDERIETERGALVPGGVDVDERGWPRNRWVDVRFD